ncbi:MAG TPA: non-canonical purine NTP pyrophosphatase [Polyangiaceae bacterium LLY-WYZ-14_1]|nr:non-canonical purine NTP pyrophosphatase [Polyangiaceae bacterium LLY-WYZ-14_1]
MALRAPTERVVVATDRDPELLGLVRPLVRSAVGSDELQLPGAEGAGDSFASSAALRARQIARIAGVAAFASDSGLVVDALGGAPGVRQTSHDRPVGPLVRRLYAALPEARIAEGLSAARVYAVALAWPDGYSEAFEARLDGRLVHPPPAEPVHTWDELFVPTGHEVPLATLPDEVRRTLDPRGRAVQRLGEAWIRGAA